MTEVMKEPLVLRVRANGELDKVLRAMFATDGPLQTVLLNLMPEDAWHDSTLPLRCVQYPANRDNLAGLLRNVLAQFVSVYV